MSMPQPPAPPAPPAPKGAAAPPPQAAAGGTSKWTEAMHPRGRGGKWIVSKGAGFDTGQQDPTTLQLQQRLKQLGFNVPQDGKFGVYTEQAVKQFQQQYGLDPSGGVDAATLQLLRSPAGSEGGPTMDYNQAVAAKAAAKAATPGAQKTAANKAAAAKKKAAAAKTAAAKKTAAAQKKAAGGTTPAAPGVAAPTTATGAKKVAAAAPAAPITPAVHNISQLGTINLQQGLGMTGSPNPAVATLQAALGQMGYKLNQDGRFGPQTEAAVTKLQTDHGLTADGIVGPETKGLLLGMESQVGAKAATATSASAKRTAANAKRDEHKVLAQEKTRQKAEAKAQKPAAQAKPGKTSGGKMKLQKPKSVNLKHSAPAPPTPDLEEQLLSFGWGNQPSLSIKDARDVEPDTDLPLWSSRLGAKVDRGLTPGMPGDDDLGLLDNNGDRPPTRPPGYYELGIGEAQVPRETPMCARCTRFDGGNICLGYSYPVSRTGACEDYDDLAQRLGVASAGSGSVANYEVQLAEAVAARKAATSTTEFTYAYAREQALRKLIGAKST